MLICKLLARVGDGLSKPKQTLSKWTQVKICYWLYRITIHIQNAKTDKRVVTSTLSTLLRVIQDPVYEFGGTTFRPSWALKPRYMGSVSLVDPWHFKNHPYKGFSLCHGWGVLENTSEKQCQGAQREEEVRWTREANLERVGKGRTPKRNWIYVAFAFKGHFKMRYIQNEVVRKKWYTLIKKKRNITRRIVVDG